jgi:teichuronic acid exporter
MSLGEKMRRGALWLSASQVASRGFEFVFGVILARLLAPEDFGLLVTVQVFTGIAGYFAAGGMSQALIQKKEVAERDYQVVFTAQLLICSLIYLLFFSISPLFAEWYGRPIYHDLLRVTTVSFLLRPFLLVPRARLDREMRFKANGILQSCGLAISGISSVSLALQNYGVWSLVLGSIIGTTCLIVPTCIAARWMPKLNFGFTGLRDIGAYGIKATCNDFLDYIRTQTPNFLIGTMRGPAMVGLFNKADSLSAIPMNLVSGSIYHPVFRALSQFQDDPEKSKYLYLRSLTLTTFYGLPFYVFLWWLAEPFILVVYGQKWLPCAEPLRILSLAGLFWIIINQSGALIAAHNRLSRELMINVQVLLLLVIAVAWGLPHGLWGVALGMLGVNAYYCLRMARVANAAVGSGIVDVMLALWPPLFLNGLLAGVLCLADFSWRRAGYSNPVAYMFMMSGVGVMVYLAVFITAPFRSLAAEAARWRQILGLSRSDMSAVRSET